MRYINRRTNERNLKSKRVLGTIALNNMNYKQAKKAFPKLRARGDVDGDGVINKKDCHPFDEKRQDDYEEDEIRNWGLSHNRKARQEPDEEEQSADDLLRSL